MMTMMMAACSSHQTATWQCPRLTACTQGHAACRLSPWPWYVDLQRSDLTSSALHSARHHPESSLWDDPNLF